METTAEKIKKAIKDNFLYGIIFIICAVYLLRGLVTVEESGKTIWQIIADGVITLIYGFSITRLFDLQGLRKGEYDSRVIATYTLHAQEVTLCTPFLDKGEEWCDIMNNDAYAKVRTKMLSKVGIKYESNKDLFGMTDNLPDLSKFTRKQLRVIHKAQRLKLSLLSISELTSEGGKDDDPLYLGESKTEYERKTITSGLASKIIVAIISGYFSLEFVKTFDWGAFIFVIIQVALFVGFGAAQYMKSLLFIVDTYRNRVINKINYLQIFRCAYGNQKVEVNENGKE